MSSPPTTPQPDDAAAFGLDERRSRTRRLLVIAAVVLLPVGWIAVSDLRLWLARREARLTPAQAAQLMALLDAREAAARRTVEQWNAASRRSALVGWKVTDAPCPVDAPAPSPVSAATYVKLATHDDQFGGWSLCVLRPDADSGACAVVYAVPTEVAQLRERVAQGDAYSWDLERAQAAVDPPDPLRALVVVETEVPAKLQSAVVGQLSYVPGTLSGQAFLYSPAEGRMVCGGAVSAANSKAVEAEYSDFGGGPSARQKEEEGRAALGRDLEVRLRLALPKVWRKLEGG